MSHQFHGRFGGLQWHPCFWAMAIHQTGCSILQGSWAVLMSTLSLGNPFPSCETKRPNINCQGPNVNRSNTFQNMRFDQDSWLGYSTNFPGLIGLHVRRIPCTGGSRECDNGFCRTRSRCRIFQDSSWVEKTLMEIRRVWLEIAPNGWSNSIQILVDYHFPSKYLLVNQEIYGKWAIEVVSFPMKSEFL